MKVKYTLVMKNCTKKLTYFVCSFCLIHTKEREKTKTKILIRMRKNKFHSKEFHREMSVKLQEAVRGYHITVIIGSQ